jgi:hypothetical protein
MGMGEPAYNWRAVKQAMRIVMDTDGIAIGALCLILLCFDNARYRSVARDFVSQFYCFYQISVSPISLQFVALMSIELYFECDADSLHRRNQANGASRFPPAASFRSFTRFATLNFVDSFHSHIHFDEPILHFSPIPCSILSYFMYLPSNMFFDTLSCACCTCHCII